MIGGFFFFYMKMKRSFGVCCLAVAFALPLSCRSSRGGALSDPPSETPLSVSLSLSWPDSVQRVELIPYKGVFPSGLVLDGPDGLAFPDSGAVSASVPWDAPRANSFRLCGRIRPDFPGLDAALILHGEKGVHTVRLSVHPPFPVDSCRIEGRAFPLGVPSESGMEVEELPQSFLQIPPGEYSGITSLGNGSYAVVHDKAPGGGIFFFQIPLDEWGQVGPVTVLQAPGTLSGEAGKDAEGIAYHPAAGTLFVSMESDQSIREFDLEGMPTGRVLAVPAGLGRDRIAANRGFEGLTFQPDSNAFWAATEAPLLSDADWLGGGIIPLQRFSAEDLCPGPRYFYPLDAPTASSGGSLAYVHGVSALTALPDGRILVLERELRVPNGSFLDKLTGSFSRTRIYAVDPDRDPSGVLSKSRVAEFSCGALTLADFEGMCLGPVLPDGTFPLLLIADSQNSMGGLVQEYVKVLKLSL